MTIKALPSWYKGVKFRSRTEARWAVAFSEYKIDWIYEPDGFVLDDDTCYLPDFKISYGGSLASSRGDKYWVEVKPIAFSIEELTKAWKLCKNTNTPVLLLVGNPSHKTYVYLDNGELAWKEPLEKIGVDLSYFDCKVFWENDHLYVGVGGSTPDWDFTNRFKETFSEPFGEDDSPYCLDQDPVVKALNYKFA
tara:strand:- start:57 stop:635 length:579 start_codon:yes stop_codon:yes gene_type:complete